ncbi:CDP-alcohol phosphatidyltransferase family protein [Nonomuraea rhizosphaerae]|uniref:CDP-alcohol phosphatidyltransferase family protein n=1 Tax=Nonomuraea rhizosphaerae TaxID=2665663 RepID=UPI001C5F0C43|nr:CDP-alcohol phosphatidyltransferase family protein [Nonomuraea rhizosphaerae]
MPDSLTRDSATTSVVVLATTPASRLSCADGTLRDRLSDQLAVLPVLDVQVLGPGGGLGADLRGVAKIARFAPGAVVVLPADLVAHTEALALLLEHPARDTAALVSFEATAAPMRPPVRVEGARVIAAGSSFHLVPEANATFRGVLQAGETDLTSLADVAEELAELAETGKLGPVTTVEAVDLLLVGLVRSGVPVRAAGIGPLHCDRVTGQVSADNAIGRLADVDESRVRLDAAVKDDDGFFATYFVSPWTRLLIRPAARLKLTPNAVTGISIGVAALSAVWFSAGYRGAQVAGSCLLYLSFALDCLDGQLARYTRTFSPLGAWADAMADRLKEYAVYVGLAFGYAAGLPLSESGPDGIWYLAGAAMILQVVRHAIDYSYAGAVADAGRAGASWDPSPVRSLLESADAGRYGVPRQGMLGLAQRMERERVTRWLKKAVVLPIGERMALIAITAGVWNARVTFVALLGWGGVAALYQVIGRIARSAR